MAGARSEFLGGVGALLGDRLGQCRVEDGQWLCVTVIDLDDADEVAIRALADDRGVSNLVRIDRADPEHLAAWEQLRHDLTALADAPRRVLRAWPTPDPGYRRPPVRILLAGPAQDVAADLHARYGDFVQLTVGAQRYPPDAGGAWGAARPVRETVDPRELRVETDVPLVVAVDRGDRPELRVTNPGDAAVELHTTGSIFADVADPADGRIVGTSSGMRTQALVRYVVRPGDTVQVPLHIGTDCVDPALGYVVPPGEWLLVVPLDLSDGRQLEARLPLTIRGS